MSAGHSSFPGFRLNRRAMLGVAGASALSLKLGALDFASSLFADELPAAKPRIQVVFLRPDWVE